MTPAPPRVSILMAVYNAHDFLEQAIESVLAQTMPHWELLCVDDCSTDDSPTLLRQYAARDARIRVTLLPQNRGAAAARNTALALSHGQWITMLDSDDWFAPDTLERALNCEAPGTDAIMLDLIHHYPGRPPKRHNRHLLSEDPVKGYDAFLWSLDWTLHGLMLVRRELHLRYPYDEHLRWYSDDNTSRLHLLHARRVDFSFGEYHYRHHAASNTTAVTPARFLLLEANRDMQQMLQDEGFPEKVRRLHRQTCWTGYVGHLRLYHIHAREFTPAERREIKERFRRLYPTFGRRTPYPLFLLRQWAGYFLRRLAGRE